MGEKIRRDLTKNIPGAKQAYLPRHLSLKGTNVGVENAREEDIREALLNAKPLTEQYEEIFQLKDLYKYGLLGNEDSSYKREKICEKLKIGHANGKILLKRLNSFKISVEELENALKEVEQSKDYLNRK